MKIVFNWDGSLYDKRPSCKTARVLTQADLQALQARYTVVIEKYD